MFDELKPTRVDMFVAQDNVPYPIMVPSFPEITTDNTLDYGNKIEAE